MSNPRDLPPEACEPLPPPPELPRRRGSELLSGLTLLPEQRLGAFSAEQLEIVVANWLNETVSRTYARVVLYGSSGDRGRDVVGYESKTADDPWDNFQCKRYAAKLAPADLWSEIGKLLFWVTRGAYSTPRRYTFVAPKGCGPKTLDLLKDAEAVRAGLIKNWSTKCADLCGLDDIRGAIESFVFPDFDVVAGEQLVNDLRGTSVYSMLFGGGLSKPRPPSKTPPPAVGVHELPYIGKLVDAYADHCVDAGLITADDAAAHETYGPHLRASRRDFYCAESLREFSKDVLIEPDDFESLQETVYDGVKYTAERDFPSGYDRVLGVCEQAATVQVGDHPLSGDLTPADRSGMCHQLANEDRLTWRK
jgi:hypothetical protein